VANRLCNNALLTVLAGRLFYYTIRTVFCQILPQAAREKTPAFCFVQVFSRLHSLLSSSFA